MVAALRATAVAMPFGRDWHGACFVTGMNIAIPHWQGRVSPVFDVAGRALVFAVADGAVQGREDVVLPDGDLYARTALLAQLGVDTLICGAISRPLEMALASAGVEVFSQTCGDVGEVLRAFLEGRIAQGPFLMPGCCGRRRRARRGCGRGRRGGMP